MGERAFQIALHPISHRAASNAYAMQPNASPKTAALFFSFAFPFKLKTYPFGKSLYMTCLGVGSTKAGPANAKHYSTNKL